MSDLQPLHDPSQQLVLTFVYAPDKNPALVYLAALSPVGRRGMAGRLRQVAQLLGYEDFVTVPWHLLRYAHLGAIRTKLSELGKAPATVNTTLYALRGVARAAFNLELMSAEDYQRLQGVKPLRGERLPAGRALAGGELTALMEACLCDDSPAGIRDCALIGLLYGAGLRRAEVVTLNLTDYDSANNARK